MAYMDPNVLLVVLDSVRARNTSLHDHHNETTPFLRKFSDQATVFSQARAPSSWSLPSHISMFTGYHAEEHDIKSRDQRLEPGHTIWEELSNEGYCTGVFSSNPFLTVVPVGLRNAFENVVGQVEQLFPEAANPREFVREEGQGHFTRYLKYSLSHDKPLQSLANGVFEKIRQDYPKFVQDSWDQTTSGWEFVDKFLNWSDECEGPWAACINLMDAHQAYEPSDEYDEWGGDKLYQMQKEIDSYMWEFIGGKRPWWQRKALEGLYDGTIRQLDSQLSTLIRQLERREVLDETLLIITSDHGEGFGEPSHIRPDGRAVGHGNGVLHEVALHVPLIVQYPEQKTGERIDSVVSLVEFPSVVRNVLDGKSTGRDFVTGDPVVASSSGLNERMKRKARNYCDDLWLFDAPTRAVFMDRDDGRVDKYMTWRDRHARVEIVDAQSSFSTSKAESDIVDGTFESLEDRSVATSSRNVSEAVERRLEDLGYA